MKIAYVGWTSASAPKIAVTAASDDRDRVETNPKKIAINAGTKICFVTVAGSASSTYEPPWPAAKQ